MIDSPKILLILSIALLAELGVAVLMFESSWTPAEPHENFAAMEVGGERAIDDASHWWFGVVVGVTFIALLTTCLTFAVSNTEHKGSLGVAISLGGFVFASVFVAMMLAYRSDLVSDTHQLLGPFPPATTLMVYGFWVAPVVFALLYVVGFYRWFAPDDSKDQATTSETND